MFLAFKHNSIATFPQDATSILEFLKIPHTDQKKNVAG